MQPIVSFDNVYKHYYLGSYRSYSRYLVQGLFPGHGRLEAPEAGDGRKPGELWALNGVSFEVHPGETLGIIGPNGAGKTTTLSLLAGITAPSLGSISVKGRVSALIQLGAGFHPELTGRENIFLNGTIMGLSKQEIRQKFEAIVDFSELEEFIDTPLKRYSSGMHVRLGFAVAAHIQPEILLIDEVLAVGDMAFKTKCYKKIRDLRKNGTTVILVSHDMIQVKNLCDRAILLHKGQVNLSGDVDPVVTGYYKIATEEKVKKGPQTAAVGAAEAAPAAYSPVSICNVRLLDGNGAETEQFATGDTLRLAIEFQAHERIQSPYFGMGIQNLDGMTLIGVNSKADNVVVEAIEGLGTMEFTLPELSLLPGNYLVTVTIHDQYMGVYDRHMAAYQFKVVSGPISTGVFMPAHEWQLKTV